MRAHVGVDGRAHGNLLPPLTHHSGVDECEQFVRAEMTPLLRAAYLMTGDRYGAQDLVQETLIRVIDQWKRVSSAASPHAYARKIMVNEFLASRRRLWRRELPYAWLPEESSASTELGRVDDHDLVREALMALPARQRAAVVLRHYEDRSEAETAAALGCSVGNVKSLTSRGLDGLRERLAADEPQMEES